MENQWRKFRDPVNSIEVQPLKMTDKSLALPRDLVVRHSGLNQTIYRTIAAHKINQSFEFVIRDVGFDSHGQTDRCEMNGANSRTYNVEEE